MYVCVRACVRVCLNYWLLLSMVSCNAVAIKKGKMCKGFPEAVYLSRISLHD